MKFVIIVEGDTEKLAIQDFIKRWLDEKLSEKVSVKRRLRIGGKKEKGFQKLANTLIATDNEIIGVIGLLDLYGMGDKYEGTTRGADALFNETKESIENAVSNTKFRMFFAVHEFEAWLFSDPGIFPVDLRDDINKLSSKPETINFNDYPSKRLKEIYSRKTKSHYKKTTDGPNLFSKLNPFDACDKCPHLKLMLDEMESMANSVGIQSK